MESADLSKREHRSLNQQMEFILQHFLLDKATNSTDLKATKVKQRIFAMMPQFEGLWLALDKAAQERMAEPDVSKMSRKLSPEKRSWVRAMYTVTNGIACLEELSKRRWTNVMEVAIGQHAIPNGDALDKILRYETAVNRDLGRALDRLERLQRRRRGEMIRPPVSVRLTR
jgi:hypothetical protein